MCLRIESPAISRVGSGGCPALSNRPAEPPLEKAPVIARPSFASVIQSMICRGAP